MVKTRKQLVSLLPHYHATNLPDFENDTLYYFLDEFYYDKGKFVYTSSYLTDKEAIDIYNKLHFHEEFLDRL